MATKTKGALVNKALSFLRINDTTSRPEPSEISDALDTLELMMAEFSSINICSSYAFEDFPNPATESGIDNKHFPAASYSLGVRLSIDYGKQLTPTQSSLAASTLSTWINASGKPNDIRYPRRMARGSGNTFRNIGFNRYYRQSEPAPTGCSTRTLRVDGVNDFQVSFTGYLNTGETISSYAVESDAGITVVSDSESSGVISLRCQGITRGHQIIIITVTTSTGRINPLQVDFDVVENEVINNGF